MRPNVVIVPGWKNSGPDHWQTRWQARLRSASRVVQHDWEQPHRADWVEALTRHVDALEGSIVLVAHSLGCITVASLPDRILRRVDNALLVAPADTERADAPAALDDFAPIPLRRLPFRSTLVASTNDPFCALRRATHFAECWGSRVVTLADAGHINAESGHGEWSGGFRLLSALRKAAQWPSGPRAALAATAAAATASATLASTQAGA